MAVNKTFREADKLVGEVREKVAWKGSQIVVVTGMA